MDNSDYKIVLTYKVGDIKPDDYVLYDGYAYKIRLKRYNGYKKIYTHIICKCRNFVESKNEFIRFEVDENFSEYLKFKKEVSKIFFTIKNAIFMDYNDAILSILDEENNVVDIKCNNYEPCKDEIIKYIKFGENYKILRLDI